MAAVWLIATYGIAAVAALVLILGTAQAGFAVALLRVGAMLFGSTLALPLGYLLLTLVFPHLADPSTREEQFAGALINFTVALIGGACGSHWYSNVERADARRSINLSRTELRRRDAEALRTLQSMSEQDPTLRPLVEQLRQSQRATRKFLEREGLFTNRRKDPDR